MERKRGRYPTDEEVVEMAEQMGRESARKEPPAVVPKPRPTAAERKLKKELKDLSGVVSTFLAALDVVMKEPPSLAKGRRIGRLATYLDMANDRTRYFTLGMDIGKGKPKANAAGVERFLEVLAREQDEIRRVIDDA